MKISLKLSDEQEKGREIAIFRRPTLAIRNPIIYNITESF